MWQGEITTLAQYIEKATRKYNDILDDYLSSKNGSRNVLISLVMHDIMQASKGRYSPAWVRNLIEQEFPE